MIATKITYREFEPDLRLKDYIKSYWYFNIRTDSVETFDILPDGYFDLLVIIKANRIVETKLTGIWSKSVSINYSENAEIFGIRFKPISIGNIFDFGIKEFLNDSMKITLKDIKINDQILLESLYGLPEFLKNYLDILFLENINTKKTDIRLKKCFDIVDKSAGCESISRISETVGLSLRQLHRLVTNMIGIGLKDYSRIVRFKKSLRKVKNDKSDYLYYYDQSHFIHEIKNYTGLTPEKIDLNNNVRFIQYYNFNSI